jgi:UTP--glucose-1-phosphate uridylyltransferase
LAVVGRYVLSSSIFAHIRNLKPGAGGEIQLTDAMLRLMEVQAFHAVEFEGRDFDCGSRLGYAEAFVGYALNDPELGADVRAMINKLLARQ